jgi:hypothetical protein
MIRAVWNQSIRFLGTSSMRATVVFIFLLLLAGCALPKGSTNTLDQDAISGTTPQEIRDCLKSTEGIFIKDADYGFEEGNPLYGLNESDNFETVQFVAFPPEHAEQYSDWYEWYEGSRVTIVRAEDIESAHALFEEVREYYFTDCKWGLPSCYKPLAWNRVNVGNDMGSVQRSARYHTTRYGDYERHSYAVFFMRNNFVVLVKYDRNFPLIWGFGYKEGALEEMDDYSILIDEAIR